MAVIWQQIPNADVVKKQSRFPTVNLPYYNNTFESKDPKRTLAGSPDVSVHDSRSNTPEAPANTKPVN